MERQVDVEVQNEGTIMIFRPLTERAKEWIEQNVQTEPHQRFGTGIAVEHRYAWDLAAGMTADGLAVR